MSLPPRPILCIMSTTGRRQETSRQEHVLLCFGCSFLWSFWIANERPRRGFPDSPVLETLSSHCSWWVQPMVRELRSHKLLCSAKREIKWPRTPGYPSAPLEDKTHLQGPLYLVSHSPCGLGLDSAGAQGVCASLQRLGRSDGPVSTRGPIFTPAVCKVKLCDISDLNGFQRRRCK